MRASRKTRQPGLPKALGTVVPAAFLAVGLAVLSGCRGGDDSGQPSVARKPGLILHADSLATPFESLERAFEAKHTDLDVMRESSGSRLAARKVMLGRPADVIAVADYLIVDQMLRPEFADWYVCFATNQVGIARTDASRYGGEISAENWFEILTRPKVNVGAGNPNEDPCGYWTELCWKLADLHYKPEQSIYERMMKKCPRETRLADAQQLLARAESMGGTDYVWVYKSQADAHHVPFVSLPPEINLSDPAHAARYGQVSVELEGKEPSKTVTKRGHPIIFAICTLKSGQNAAGAVKWVQFVLSDDGRTLLEKSFLPVTNPPFTFSLAEIPEALRAGVEERPKPEAASATTQ